MLVKFVTDHDGWAAGEIADIEHTLGRRLIGLGKAELCRREKPKAETDPQPAAEPETAESPKAEKRETATGKSAKAQK